MLKKINIKNIIVGIFVIGTVFGFMVFTGAVKLGKDAQNVKGKVVIWGTIPYNTMQPYIDMVSSNNLTVSYKVKDPTRYESDLVDAFAAGKGPDLFIMSHEGILRNADKVFVLPYTSFPKDKYLSTYINESKLFLMEKGILAIPMYVDPLVMYYNKQLIASSFLVGVPQYWDEFMDFVSQITVKDPNGNISIAGTAMGTYDNIRNAKSLISALLLQGGNSIVGTNKMTGQKQATIAFSDDATKKAMQSLNFYLSFAQQGAKNYSWNEALELSREKFIAGGLAFYFGHASELEKIRKKNPNLDFDLTLIPQTSATSLKTTFGSMTGIAIAKQTKNVSAAINVASKLSGKDVVKGLTQSLFVAPARFDLLKQKPEDPHINTFYKSAIISYAWVDPSPQKTSMLLRNLIRSVNSGALSLHDALRKTNADLDILLNQTINKSITNKLTDIKK